MYKEPDLIVNASACRDNQEMEKRINPLTEIADRH